jgi:DNA polymerase/3'-5' exonuclease PolX
MKSNIPYNQAKVIADVLVELLQPVCEVVFIAGSVRRKKETVGDIELVVLPKKTEVVEGDLFESKTIKVVDEKFGDVVNGFGKIIKGKYDGKYMQIELPSGINLDLFIPSDYDLYRQYAVRTGSGDYSFKVIANGWKRIGWCGSDAGLRKISDCEETKTPEGKSKWKCINPNAELPPHWKSEQEFFDWIKVPYIEPELRNI